MLSLTGLNQKSTYGLMVKRLRRCPLTAESAVRFRMGLPKKREANTSGVGFAFFVAPERNLRGNLLPSFVFAPANLAEGFPHAGNGKFRMELRYDYKKFLESARQTRFAVVRQFAARQIPQMITNKKYLERTRQSVSSFVNLPQGNFLPKNIIHRHFCG